MGKRARNTEEATLVVKVPRALSEEITKLAGSRAHRKYWLRAVVDRAVENGVKVEVETRISD